MNTSLPTENQVNSCLAHISLASFLWDIGKQCRPRPDAASDQDPHSLLEECSFKISIKMKHTTQQPLKHKLMVPIDNGVKIPLGLNGLRRGKQTIN